jgi:nucleotide-binding universal stress UspA family protein
VKIVVGYLPTPPGEAALEAAVEEAELRGGELVVLHSSRGGSSETLDEVNAIRDARERIEADLKRRGVAFRFREYAAGRAPSEDIIAVAEEEGAGLIVIGLRKRTMTGKMLLGSNAHDILMQAPCPVLAVRAAESS